MDVVVPSYTSYENGDSSSRNATGFLAGNAVEYAEAMSKVFMLSETEKTKTVKTADGTKRVFSEELFCKRFVECLQPILKACSIFIFYRIAEKYCVCIFLLIYMI